MHPGVIWNGETLGGRVMRTLLIPASWLYALGWQTYLAIYRLGVKKASHPHSPILCVGNLLAGGGGKSPLTLHLVKLLREMGRSVVVGASGYGSPQAEAATVAPDGVLDPHEWGDEPAMMRSLVPDLPLIVGRRRVLAAELCHQKWPGAVLLMDDGFQHMPLRKDVSILLDPPENKNRRCLPAGPYREPWGNRRRADLVLPGQFRIVAEPLTFTDPDGAGVEIHEALVLCAIARPESFLDSVRAAGVEIRDSRIFPDHSPLDAGTLLDGISADVPIVVTAKDWVKLARRPDISGYRIVVARYSVHVEPAADFKIWLQERLGG